MIKKNLLISILLICAIKLSVQSQNVILSEELTEPKGTNMDGLVWARPDGFIIAREKGRRLNNNQIWMERYNQDAEPQGTKEYELNFEDKDLGYAGCIETKDNLFLMSYFINQKLDKNFLFMQEMDPVSLALTSIRKVAEVPSINKFNSGNFDFRTSPDSTKILIYGNTYYKKNEPEKLLLQVNDEQDFTPLWSKEITLPYTDKLFDVIEYKVGDNAKAYLLGKVYDDKAIDKRRGEVNFHYIIYCYSPGEAEPVQYEVSLGEVFITDLSIQVNAQGDIICAGFISDRGTYSIKGVTYFTIDGVSGEIRSKSIKEFGTDFLEEFMSEKAAAKGKELYNYDLRGLITKSDGGAVLLAEQYYVRVVTYTSSGANGMLHTYTTYYYYYNHIIVTSISPQGEIEWCIKVPKIQVTTNDGGYYSSFAAAVCEDKIYLLFNDNPKNLEIRESTKIFPFNGRGSVGILVTVDEKGSWEKSLLFSNKEEGIIMRPKVCSQMGPHELMVFGEIRRNYKVGKVSF